MIAKVQKWGNSQGIRFSKAILEQSKITVGDLIEISAKKGQITIKQKEIIKGKYDLKDLVKRIPKNYKTSESDWGAPVGNEEW
jgi:antitoxin MazE